MTQTTAAVYENGVLRPVQPLALARSRADRYPPGFRADVSREGMYEGCGE